MKKGFTLIEVMVAIFMISLGVMAVLIIFPLGIRIIKSSDLSTTGSVLAQEKIEEVMSLSYSDLAIGTTNETLSSPFNGFTRQTRITYVDPPNGMAESGSETYIKKIEVTVSWTSPLGIGSQNIKITTLYGEK